MKKTILALCAVLTLVFACAAYAANPVEGTYKYAEKGHKGTMTIKRQGPGFVFVFKTESLGNGQMCDFTTYETPMDQGGGREDDSLPAKGGTADDGIKFTIRFAGNGAVVDVESKGSECGMSGYFGGSYVKAGK